jgi:hypothetical protein
MRFQAGVEAWMEKTFSPEVCADIQERGDRLLEEVLELLQAHGYDKARIQTLVDYTYGRPVGEPFQELGGVMVTLAAFSSAAGMLMKDAGEAELDRIWHLIPQIQAKQKSKRGLHSLPIHKVCTRDCDCVGECKLGLE